MQSLILFLWRNISIIIYLIVMSFSIWLIAKNDSYQSAAIINASNDIAGNFYKKQYEYFEYLKLKQINDQLRNENELLLKKLPQYRFLINNAALMKSSNDSISIEEYNFFSAKVINNSVSSRVNYLTLDKGKINGVKKDMGVFSNNHAIGVIKNVSEHFCTVLPLLNIDSRTSAKIKRNSAFGSLGWDGVNQKYVYLKDIATHIDVKKGDTVVTTGFSPSYPEGLLIGIVESFENEKSGNFINAKVKLSFDMTKLNYVFIVDNILRREREMLQDSISH